MKNIMYIALAILTLASCQQSQKIGFIDNGKVINDYQKKIDLEEEFKAKDLAFQKRTDSIGKAFQLEVQQTQVLAQKETQSKAQELMGGLQQKQQVLQQQMQYEQQQLQQQFQVEIDSIITKVKDFVKDYGKNNGFTYILGSNEAGSVMFGAEENDLTEAVTKALNTEHSK